LDSASRTKSCLQMLRALGPRPQLVGRPGYDGELDRPLVCWCCLDHCSPGARPIPAKTSSGLDAHQVLGASASGHSPQIDEQRRLTEDLVEVQTRVDGHEDDRVGTRDGIG
jgi:hypothetical protein